MPFWQRLLITLVAMVVTSLVVGLIWRALFGFELPSYLGGSDRRSDRGAGVGVPQAHRTQDGDARAAALTGTVRMRPAA